MVSIIIIIIDDCLFRMIEASCLICYRVVMTSLTSVAEHDVLFSNDLVK